MKRILVMLLTAVFVLAMGAGIAAHEPPGPAPNSGDGIPDGSGFDGSPAPGPMGDAFGPNPLAGDCIPNETPSGPA